MIDSFNGRDKIVVQSCGHFFLVLRIGKYVNDD